MTNTEQTPKVRRAKADVVETVAHNDAVPKRQ
jgi:hypothetical protein